MTNRLASGDKLVVASHNPGKAWEIHQLIAPYAWRLPFERTWRDKR